MARLEKKYQYRKNRQKYFQTYQAAFQDCQRAPKRTRISLKTKNKAIARQLLVQLEQDYAVGKFDPWNDPLVQNGTTVSRAVEKFVQSRRTYCSPSTTETYRYVLGAFADSLRPDFPLTGVEERHISKYLNGDRAEQTIRSYPPTHSDLLQLVSRNWAMQGESCRAREEIKGFAEKRPS